MDATTTGPAAPTLAGQARAAVEHRGSHLQIIASAGSGKTEVVAQRIVELLSQGASPSSIVAFTFTERAAESLSTRVEERVKERLGSAVLDTLTGCFIGTIHAYCFRVLQQYVPRYETYDVLDENRLAAFLVREERQIQFKSLSSGLYRAIGVFVRNMDVVDNELVNPSDLEEPFRGMADRFLERLATYRLLTYGQIIARLVEELGNPETFAIVHGPLRHLIVDEYQDINPAQEALIRRLAEDPVELCVVGDDDQALYQWRGSDVKNILEFRHRYPGVTAFELTTNRRSKPTIVGAANTFVTTITERLPKRMSAHRESDGSSELVTWCAPSEREEAELIAETIVKLHRRGFQYRDIAILVRGRVSYPLLLESLNDRAIPIRPVGRTGLFTQTDAQLFGRMCAFLAGHDWRPTSYGSPSEPVTLRDLATRYREQFGLTAEQARAVRERLEDWRYEVTVPTRPSNLVREYYDLLSDCDVPNWDFDDPFMVARLGTLARCSAILADFESIRRRSRPDLSSPGEVIGGSDRGQWYYFGLATHVQNWAIGAYEQFEGEDDIGIDAVDLTTIHKAKGLEWPVVFVPGLTTGRFPSSRTGSPQPWHVPRTLFNVSRYEGSDVDERRLFYVALTRAREWVSVSSHELVKTRRTTCSPYLTEIAGGKPGHKARLPLPTPPPSRPQPDEVVNLSFSELSSYATCALAYRFRTLLGFQPALAPELGYGKAVHHLMRELAERTRLTGIIPTEAQLDALFDSDFYLPAASKPAHQQLKAAARRLVDTYIKHHSEDLRRVWALERPFELHLPGALISGRADVILDYEGGVVSSLAIVDYKTSTDPAADHSLQLQVYADAGRREGLNVSAAYVQDLKASDRKAVGVSDLEIARAEQKVARLVTRLRAKDFSPSPGPSCYGCDMRTLCRHAVARSARPA